MTSSLTLERSAPTNAHPRNARHRLTLHPEMQRTDGRISPNEKRGRIQTGQTSTRQHAKNCYKLNRMFVYLPVYEIYQLTPPALFSVLYSTVKIATDRQRAQREKVYLIQTGTLYIIGAAFRTENLSVTNCDLNSFLTPFVLTQCAPPTPPCSPRSPLPHLCCCPSSASASSVPSSSSPPCSPPGSPDGWKLHPR